jgi:hypothetical protein
MSKARLAGLLGALAAYAGGFGVWASPAAADPPVAARVDNHRDIDLAMLRQAEAQPAATGLIAHAGVPADRSATSDVEVGPAPRKTQPAGLPSPGNWLLMVIGVGMIGGALRGFIVANRALARLQPEELDYEPTP